MELVLIEYLVIFALLSLTATIIVTIFLKPAKRKLIPMKH